LIFGKPSAVVAGTSGASKGGASGSGGIVGAVISAGAGGGVDATTGSGVVPGWTGTMSVVAGGGAFGAGGGVTLPSVKAAPLSTTGSPVATAAISGTGWAFLVFVAVDWTHPASAVDSTVAQRIGNHEDAHNRGTVADAIGFPAIRDRIGRNFNQAPLYILGRGLTLYYVEKAGERLAFQGMRVGKRHGEV
jgi:hypothetical protein